MEQLAQEQAEQTTNELKREWGNAFGDKVAAAKDVVDQFPLAVKYCKCVLRMALWLAITQLLSKRLRL